MQPYLEKSTKNICSNIFELLPFAHIQHYKWVLLKWHIYEKTFRPVIIISLLHQIQCWIISLLKWLKNPSLWNPTSFFVVYWKSKPFTISIIIMFFRLITRFNINVLKRHNFFLCSLNFNKISNTAIVMYRSKNLNCFKLWFCKHG